MNKNVMLIGAVIVVLLILAGGFFVLNKNKAPVSSKTTPKATENNVISSISDALSKSMSLKCEYTTPSGTKTVVYIKNGMVRSEVKGATASVSGNSIIRDNKIYYWNVSSGFVIKIPQISTTPAAGKDATGMQSTLAALEQYKNYCKKAAIDDSEFVLPADVKFQDMSTMMPSGVLPSGKVPTPDVANRSSTPAQPAPTGMSKQQIEEMMKKYQNPSQ